VETALTLAHSKEAPVYRVFSSNCEHLAWQLDASSAYKGRWVSPQVPHNLWKLFRFCLNLVGLLCLWALAVAPTTYSATHTIFASLYHLFTTIPVGAQVQACLVRTAVNLTQRRCAGELEKGTFEYLMIKETLRAAWLTFFCVGLLCMMPRLVWDSGSSHFRLAAAISLCAYNVAVIGFNSAHQICTRALLHAGVGVPMPVFDDLRSSSPRSPRTTSFISKGANSSLGQAHATGCSRGFLASTPAVMSAPKPRRRACSPGRS